MSVKDISSFKNQVYKKLKQVLNEYDSTIPVFNYQGKIEKTSVVLKELTNNLNSKDGTNTQNLRNVSYDIKIYTTKKGKKHSIQVAEEIQNYIVYVMEDFFRLTGGVQSVIPNANTDNATITTLRYSGLWYVERNFIYN